jgi:prepilin-type N-terminal cleavage/methylation domain-containing protein
MDRQRARCGFTLVELVMVLVAISFMAGLVLPRYGSAVLRYRLKSTAHRISEDIALARTTARSRSAPVTMSFKCGTGSGYEIAGVKHLDYSGEDYRTDTEEEPYRVRIVSADFGGITDLEFNGFGVGPGGQVQLAAGQFTMLLDIDGSTGVVKMYGP